MTQLDLVRQTVATGSGTVRNSGEPFEYTVRYLTPHDIEQLGMLQHAVLRVLPPPIPIYVRDAVFFHRCITERGCVAGAWHGDRLVGYATLHVPENRDENYGVDLGLPEEELPYTAHLAGSAVHADYRGNHLQARLAELRDTFAREAGFRHLCGEVYPSNFVSIQNHLNVGYFLRGFRIDCHGDPNFMLHKELNHQPRLLDPHDLRESEADDVTRYRVLLQEGRWGFRAVVKDGTGSIVFGHFA